MNNEEQIVRINRATRNDNYYRQKKPRHQLVVNISAVQGHLMNLEDGVGNVQDVIADCLTILSRCQDIIKYNKSMEEWEKE